MQILNLLFGTTHTYERKGEKGTLKEGKDGRHEKEKERKL